MLRKRLAFKTISPSLADIVDKSSSHLLILPVCRNVECRRRRRRRRRLHAARNLQVTGEHMLRQHMLEHITKIRPELAKQ